MIDINDLNYLDAHEEFNLPFRKERYTANLGQLLKQWGIIIGKGMFALLYFFYRGYYKQLEKYDIALLGFTGNNLRVVKPIQEKLDRRTIVFDFKNLPFRRNEFYAMLYSPLVFWNYLMETGYMKKVYASEFMSFCRTYGWYIGANKILKRIKPQILVVSNDHIYFQRTFFRVAQTLGIKTVYVQHASVSENFPPLEFDYAFLDGQESLDKYTFNNKICKSKIFFLGNPRFDIIKAYNFEHCVFNNKCGIAINTVDLPDKITDLIRRLYIEIKNIKITLRAHPGSDEKFWKNFSNKNNCSFSNAKIENPFLFIAQNDFFISGESSFHLDVALTGKMSFYYNFTGKTIIDVYGYLKSGLTKVLPDNLTLIEYYINNCKGRTQLLQYYASNYGTSDWGKSATLIASKLEELLNTCTT